MRINEDGNTLGRITAFAILVVTVLGVGRIAGLSICPTTAGSCCTSQASAH